MLYFEPILCRGVPVSLLVNRMVALTISVRRWAFHAGYSLAYIDKIAFEFDQKSSQWCRPESRNQNHAPIFQKN